MKKILILTKGLQSSSSRYRALVYVDYLKKDNIISKHIGLSKRPLNYLKALINAPFYDVVFLQRKLLSKTYFSFLRFLSKKIIYDFDDAIFLDSKGNISKNKFSKFASICRNADLIFAGNEFLKKIANKFNSNTFLIPTCLDTTQYKIRTLKSKTYFDLVWVGSKSTSKYLENIIPTLEMASRTIKNIRLINISDVVLQSLQLEIRNIKWTELNQYKEIKSAKIGLAPLDDSDWSKGKCAFKLLQYASAGLPIISSDIGTNSILIKKYNSGLLVKNNNDWIKNIKKLKHDKAYYKLIAKNALKMSKSFDIAKNYNEIRKIIFS